MNIYIKNRV